MHVHSTDPKVFLVSVAISLVVAGVGYYFSRKAIVKRRLNKFGKRSIGSFSNGDVGKITGRVVFAGETMKAPLSGRKCAYYHVLVEERRGSHLNSTWESIAEEEMIGDVVLYDGKHYALVNTEEVKSYLVPDAEYDSYGDETPEVAKFLKRHDIKTTDLFGLHKPLRSREGVLEKGELVTVLGEGTWEEVTKHKLNLPARKILVLKARQEEKVFLTDDPGAAT